ncbi:hypothetical protein BJY04DRAFT_222752 [Aspergillus karnatakaensis]|uniref:uncharacterized protein n=1 Tax=Aspergillus karnatakaensis TaxID=1810916 RepID=UPI003CCCBB46
MSNYDPPYGVAIRRNGTCSSSENEVSCGNTWGDWYRCCPEDTVCGDGGVCCPTDSGCENPILADVHCANNGTWDLYEEDGYFCCDHGKTGFRATNLVSGGESVVGVGCADEYPEGEYNSAIVPVAIGTDVSSTATPSPTSSTTSTTNTPTQTAAPDTPDSDSDSSSTNVGAIAGGVVGGVAGLALIIALVWFLLRRRKQRFSQVPTSYQESHPSHFEQKYNPVAVGGELDNSVASAELSSNAVRAELDGQGAQGAHAYELPAHGPAR